MYSCLPDCLPACLPSHFSSEGLSVSVADKLSIATRLAAFGAPYIEAGFPGSNAKDAEFFRRARRGELTADVS